MNVFKHIDEFNRRVIGIDRDFIAPLNNNEFDWLRGALHEELSEMYKAWLEGDIPGQVDALIDLMYFAVGGLTRLGLTPEQSEACFAVIHAANMTKMKGRKARAVEHDMDAVKPTGWEAPETAIKLILENGK